MTQTVCITGASRGLGLGYVQHYLREGAHVLAVARQAGEKAELRALQKIHGRRLELVDADLAQVETLEPLRQIWRSQPLDLLINNAGVLLDEERDFQQLPLELLRESFEVNVIGSVAITQLALQALQKSQRPIVAMMSSLMGSISDNSSGGYYAYRSSKAALNMVTRSLARDYPWLIAIALHPGWVQTAMGGERAPTTIAESIQGLTHVIADLKQIDSGQFRNFRAQTLDW